MMDLAFIEQLLKAFDESTVDSLEIERGATRVKLAKNQPVTMAAPLTMAAAPAPAGAPPLAAGAPAPATSDDTSGPAGNLVDITSPMVGTFYRSPAPDAQAYVEVGKRVSLGDTLCIIEAMKLMNELECEVSGTIREVCVDNAQPVEYGQVLFRVDPS